MTREQQVVSLKLAKKLKELGVEQKSLFSWFQPIIENGNEPEIVDTPNIWMSGQGRIGNMRLEKIVPAYTVAELGEMMPTGESGTRKEKDGWIYNIGDGVWLEAKTEADARAAILVYLLENNLMKRDAL